MKPKRAAAECNAVEKWHPSEVAGASLAAAMAGLLVGNLMCFACKPSYTEGFDAAKKQSETWVESYKTSANESYSLGKNAIKYEAARHGTGRYEIDPTTGEVYFKWLKACDCKEGCKCTK